MLCQLDGGGRGAQVLKRARLPQGGHCPAAPIPSVLSPLTVQIPPLIQHSLSRWKHLILVLMAHK